MNSRLFQNDSLEPAAARAAVLRALADGEISEGEACTRLGIASLSASDRRAVGFERRLRQSVGVAMSATCAPAGLRRRIENAIAREDGEPDTSPLQPAGWSINRFAGTLATAAVLAISAGVVWVMYNRAAPQPTNIAATPSLLVQTASAAIDTHRAQASDSLWAIKKLAARDEASTLRICKEWLGHEPDLSRICTDSAKLVGAGTCELPHALGRSVHILVTVPCDGGIRRDASLFIMHDQGRLEVGTFGIKDVGSRCSKDAAVLVWREAGLVYLLVTGNAAVATTLSDQLGIEPIGP